MTGGHDADDWRAVEAHLRRLDESALAAFVADLWEAQGFDAERDGRRVTATKAGATVTIQVGGDRQHPPDGPATDIAVLPSESYEGRNDFGAGDLTERLRYAVEPEVADDLCRRHLGATPRGLSVPLAVRVRRRLPTATVPVAALALVGVVLLGAALGGLVGFDSDDGSPAGTPDSTDEQPSALGATQPTPDGEDTVGVDTDQLPPGVTTAGVRDLDALASAHEAALANRSYTIRLNRTHTEIRDRELVDVTREVRISVDGERYLAESTEVVDGERTPLAALYHDGSDTYRAFAGENTTYERVDSTELLTQFPPDPGNLTERVVRSRFADSTTQLAGVGRRDGERLYRISAQRRDAALADSALTRHEATANIRTDGFVRSFSTNYSYISGDVVVDVQRRLVYTRIGETTVAEPAWYGERFGAESDS